MKAVVPLLVAVLVIGILNLLQGFGMFGGSSSDESYDYVVYTVDEVGLMIKTLIDEDFQKEGKTEYPISVLQNPRITLPRLMNYMSSEGWELAAIKANGLHIFRRPVGSPLGEDSEPRLMQSGGDGEGGGDAPAAPAGDAPAAPAAPAPAAPAPAAPAAGN